MAIDPDWMQYGICTNVGRRNLGERNRRRWFMVEFLIGSFYCSATTGPTFAAQTCPERQQVCCAYCEKTYKNAPKCLDACKTYLAECLCTGCWESKVTAKRCDFTKQ